MLIRTFSLVSLIFAAALATVCFLPVQAAQPQFSGQWDISLDNTNRKCRVTLRPESGPNGYALAMPFGCKRALPILLDVERWKGDPDKNLVFATAAGTTILDFQWLPDRKALASKGPDGEAYHIEPADHNAKVAANLVPAKPTVLDAPSLAALAGKYTVIRDAKTVSICTLNLLAGKPSAKGNFRAALEAGCTDPGMKIFDPVGWRIEDDKLVLVARRGHEASLAKLPDGTFGKDIEPKSSKTLILKKL